MAVTTIPWGDGSGDNIYLTRNASEGDQTVAVTSDANTGYTTRTKVVTFATGSIIRQLTVNQEGVPEPYIVFADATVEQICATKWGDGIGLKPSQAAAVTSIGTNFRYNTAITSFDEFVYFTGVKTLPNSPFRGCTALRSITLPPNLTTINDSTFRQCSALISIEIPSKVTSIANASFYDTSNLGNVVVRRTSPPNLPATNTFAGSGSGKKKIYVPYSSDHSILAAYKSTAKWSDYASKIYELNEDGTIPT